MTAPGGLTFGLWYSFRNPAQWRRLPKPCENSTCARRIGQGYSCSSSSVRRFSDAGQVRPTMRSWIAPER